MGLSHVAIQFPLYEFFKTKFTGLEMGENTSDESNIHYVGVAGATFLSKVCATSATYPHEVLRTRLQTQQRCAPGRSGAGSASSDGMINQRFRSTSDPSYDRHAGSASSDGMINKPRYRGVMRTVSTILQEEGWRAFYNGMGTNMVRAVPAAMTTMLTFEYTKKAIYNLQAEGRHSKKSD